MQTLGLLRGRAPHITWDRPAAMVVLRIDRALETSDKRHEPWLDVARQGTRVGLPVGRRRDARLATARERLSRLGELHREGADRAHELRLVARRRTLLDRAAPTRCADRQEGDAGEAKYGDEDERELLRAGHLVAPLIGTTSTNSW